MSLKGKVAIVTGAAGQGMGRSIALTLARDGADVVVNYRKSEKDARDIVDHIIGRGSSAIAVQADIFKAAGCKILVDIANRQLGSVDICIIGPGGGWHPESIEELNPDTALQDTNNELAPLFYLMPLLLPKMYKRRRGRIIGIAMNLKNISPAYSYNVGKAARIQALLLVQSQAWKRRVTINIIAPGPVSGIGSLEEAVEQCDHGISWHKRSNISPQDVAEGVAFLCSDAANFITGCIQRYSFYE